MENPELEIDLPSQEIRRPNGAVIKFEIDPFRKKCLLEGLDDIALSLEKSEKIISFEKKLEKKGIILRDMKIYNMKNKLRVSIGSSRENALFIKTLNKII